MAKYKKGQSGNPGGRPKIPEDVKKIRVLTNNQLKETGDVLLLGSRQDLENILSHPGSAPLKCWLASIIKKGIQRGDMQSLNCLLDRLVGKVTENIKHIAPRLTIIEKIDGGEVILEAKIEDGE